MLRPNYPVTSAPGLELSCGRRDLVVMLLLSQDFDKGFEGFRYNALYLALFKKVDKWFALKLVRKNGQEGIIKSLIGR